MGVKLEGIEKLQKKLKSNCTLDDVKRVVRRNGADMQIKAQRLAPVDTGTLEKSVGLDVEDAGFTAKVEPTAEYAPYVEVGTRFMEAQPFVKPAFNEQKQKFKQDMDKLVR